MHEIDDTDRRLISLLEANARTPVAKLATELSLARTTVQARLNRLEHAKIISGYTIKLSERAELGTIHATVLIQITPVALVPVLTQLKKLHAVKRCHTTSGRFDLACELRTRSTQELDVALDQIGFIDGVKQIESLIHLSTRIDRSS